MICFIEKRRGRNLIQRYNQTYAHIFRSVYMQIYICIYLTSSKVNLCPVNNCLISIWSESLKSLVPQLGGDAACDLVHGGNDVCHDSWCWLKNTCPKRTHMFGLDGECWIEMYFVPFCWFFWSMSGFGKRFPVTICQADSLNNELEESPNSKMARTCSTTVFW